MGLKDVDQRRRQARVRSGVEVVLKHGGWLQRMLLVRTVD
jgi:hypothetical protein